MARPPVRFGRWHKIYVRFDQWSKNGWFDQLHQAALQHAGVDITQASLDSTASKLHRSAHGSKKDQAIGKSSGGWTIQVHALVECGGKAPILVLGACHRQDMPFADRGYDSEPFRKWLRNKRIRPVIPAESVRVRVRVRVRVHRYP